MNKKNNIQLAPISDYDFLKEDYKRIDRSEATQGRVTKLMRYGAAILAVTGAGWLVGSSLDSDEPRSAETITYTVAPGETHSDIAGQITDGDLRPVIDDLIDQRTATGDETPVDLMPGDTLEVPIDSPLGQKEVNQQERFAEHFGDDSPRG